MTDRHFAVLPYSVDVKMTLFGGRAVDMNRAIAALRGDKLVQRVPCDALNVVTMFCYLPYAFSFEETSV
jgi:hypothetical protein